MTSTTTTSDPVIAVPLAKVYRPRDSHEFSQIDFARPSVFLAGSIEMGKAEEWQIGITEELQHLPITILNPRRLKWDSDMTQRKSNPEFNYQVNWELDCQKEADIIAMYLQPKTMSPISLLELGIFADSKKLIVCCPVEFYRRGNVEIVCERHHVPLFDNYADFVTRVTEELEKLVKTKEANVQA
ncbi:hypothetical protein C8Q74DRAFT_1246777 [Fomes fomentarius]|nr:hypothetical protein C8Q74DRAFT_1246777 [Fomes fomentarius]